jgi:hypothetical protein
LKAASVIQREHLNCCATDCGKPFDSRALKPKVLTPLVASRAKKRHDFTRYWIDTREARPFPKVAAMTGERKVLIRIKSAMLLRKNVPM